MPKAGDQFISTLKKTHLGWGTHRYTNSRPAIKNEGYIPIPSRYAKGFYITNLHETRQSNIYKFSTSDGYLIDKELKASGNTKKGDKFAKNLHGNNDLKLLGSWFNHIGAKIGDKIKVEFKSSNEILLTKI
ncbi:hypothetical protein QE382_003175 [Sphingobacterium zeae]|uniref:Uncharacterized protein n=1 Tax=Sphingobacterium zeae TaxID=1776859 RepID=A0ABU0U8A3_9SPHI|nr:hypothetical protein [Sphingobacterium zeae]MDQ1151191.1 hypothetical protein [Sphingobacterium zeae]